MRSRNCLPFRSTWDHSRFLMGFVFQFSFLCNVLWIIVCPFLLVIVLYVSLRFKVSERPFGIFKLFPRFHKCKSTDLLSILHWISLIDCPKTSSGINIYNKIKCFFVLGGKQNSDPWMSNQVFFYRQFKLLYITNDI